MSWSSMALGKERWAGSRTPEEETGASQFSVSQRVRRPMWVIWHISAAPWAWTRSAKAWK